EKYGPEDKKVVKTRQQMAEAFLSFKLPVPMVDNFVRKLREVVTAIRTHERIIMDLCVKHARMPRKDFLRTFPGNETNLKWADELVRRKQKWSSGVREHCDAIVAEQEKLIAIEKALYLNL